MSRIDLLSLLVGFFWGSAFVVVNQIIGEKRNYIPRLIVVHVIIVMSAVFVLLRLDGSVIAAGVVALLVLALANFTEFPKNGSN
ncbi:hypothetical protein HYG81_02540 [Natrinema zhouii]|uniref:Uncharacterized protein n=1 Tax=Natrinema zhouii TaxID=1710539 RepID=A0A7D6CQB1_9EURY|nr:hypothetical protein [Natrinema zhouii]QLK26516.1 hypothetical protein HYG81_02540 [Natrinema zhouii]